MLFRIILWSIVLTVILRFISRIVLPMFQITSMTEERLRQMQRQMEEMQRRQNTPPPPPQQAKKPGKIDGEYIDYEEVK